MLSLSYTRSLQQTQVWLTPDPRNGGSSGGQLPAAVTWLSARGPGAQAETPPGVLGPPPQTPQEEPPKGRPSPLFSPKPSVC